FCVSYTEDPLLKCMITVRIAILLNCGKKPVKGICHILGDEYLSHIMEKSPYKIFTIYLHIEVLCDHSGPDTHRKTVSPQLFRELSPFPVKHLEHGHAQCDILNLLEAEHNHGM